MTTTEPAEATSSSALQAGDELYANPDPVLQMLVRAMGVGESSEMGLTLYVSGVVVSGVLVPASRYFDLLAEWLTERGAQGWADAFATPAAEMIRSSRSVNPDDSSPVPFIHLRDAQVFTSESDAPLPKVLWRGRLSHVSGWSIGTMSRN